MNRQLTSVSSILRRSLENLYAHRLRRQITTRGRLPNHLGVIMDGNRRWARQAGFTNPSIGHQYGAEHLEHLLQWCQRLTIRHVTVFVCSTENIINRGADEVAFLMNVIEITISRLLTRPDRSWQVHIAGNPDVLPGTTATALKDLSRQTAAVASGRHLTLAVGYGGQQEILHAFTDYLHEQAANNTSLDGLARSFDSSDIDRHLYQPDQPQPDIIIRTSGERRSSNFLIWQGSHADYFFCDTYWPAFREVDLLRTLRDYSQRQLRKCRN